MREWNKLCGEKGWNVGNFAYLWGDFRYI